eukprot:200071-Rhodomonas_salina.1
MDCTDSHDTGGAQADATPQQQRKHATIRNPARNRGWIWQLPRTMFTVQYHANWSGADKTHTTPDNITRRAQSQHRTTHSTETSSVEGSNCNARKFLYAPLLQRTHAAPKLHPCTPKINDLRAATPHRARTSHRTQRVSSKLDAKRMQSRTGTTEAAQKRHRGGTEVPCGRTHKER